MRDIAAYRCSRRIAKNTRRSRCAQSRRRLDVAGALLLGATLATITITGWAIAAPRATADNHASKAASSAAIAGPATIVLDKKFKGSLPITALTEDEAILQALNRLAYGPRPSDIEHIRQMGLAKWVDRQLDPKSIDDSALDLRLARYPTLSMSSKQLLDEFPPPNQAAKKEGVTKQDYSQRMEQKRQDALTQMLPTGNDNFDKANAQLAKLVGPNRITAELSMAKLDRAVYSERQLEAVMEDFWFNHFNVFADKGAGKWLLTAYVRDTIRPNVMGKFQDLLVATAKSPAMLFYLDNWLSADPVAFQRMQQETAARPQRYSGIFTQTPAGPPPRFPAQRPNAPPKQERGLNENYGREVMELHTVGVDAGYTQQDVIEMARCLTGWTVREPRKDPEFFFDENIHAQGKKTVMGHTFNSGGEKDGEEALKMLAGQHSTAKFISTELARHFVSDEPPQSLISRMAAKYESSGGDIRAVLRTMIYSPEFWSRKAYRAKVKTPFELVASTARALNADVEVTLPLVQWVGRMGEPLFQCQPPTGYSDTAETWVNSGALLNRLNFALAFASDHMGGAELDLKTMFGDSAMTDPNAALTRALDLFLDGQVAAETKQTLEERLSDPEILQARLDDAVKRVNEGLIAGLVLGAPEFQRR
jgi:uncharacterized protein (DUF1800 family)